MRWTWHQLYCFVLIEFKMIIRAVDDGGYNLHHWRIHASIPDIFRILACFVCMPDFFAPFPVLHSARNDHSWNHTYGNM